ncbi:type III secretion system export apparatus subunit SctU [Burkholderia metallica]|uniref:type III secretion system export apparatus subunit SctU n=1 Tax=Burkholderia metallica TaxID=488729 RepID=UPI001CF0F4F2|nr:type III secretion system export apparatus subunit SctU [Burkholderia metallica]MCA8002727.1 type III secretion system export apparatus subunit SctU [Burkholderia metallica]
MSDDKTEQPTEKRLRKAREDGEVSKSTDLVDGVLLAVGVGLLIALGDKVVDGLRSCVSIALQLVAGPHDMATLLSAADQIGSHTARSILPMVGAAILAAIVALAGQTGIHISLKPVGFKFSAVSPMAGIKRIFTLKSLLDLAKMTIKGVVLTIVMWQTVIGLFPLVTGSIFQTLPEISRLAGFVIIRLISVAAAIYVIFGGIDLKLQKFLFIRGKKMSKDEIKRENKQDEGDPLIKGERRRLAREFATSAPSKISSASMVVVNPTHYAVAVRYAPDEYPLPVVIAKGMDDAALQMRRDAQFVGVPIVGHPPVARALYKIELGDPIPEELFEAVAAILRWVESLGLPGNAEKPATPNLTG